MIPTLVRLPSPEGRAKAEALLGHGVPELLADANVVAPALVTDPDGTPLLAALRYPAREMAAVRAGFRNYPMDTTVRAVGVRNRSRVFGYGARRIMMQRNSCRACSGAQAAPQAHDQIVGAAPVLSMMLREALPEVGPRDEARTAEAIRPDWQMQGTQWTSGVLNHTSPLPYHYDRNNLEPVWSAMIVARRGVRGGYLHVPELDLVVDCRDGDVIFFPGWHFLHGVTPLRKLSTDSYRLTGVYYAVREMALCQDPATEVARGRADRTAREDDLRSADERMGPPRDRDKLRRRGVPQSWRRNPGANHL